METSLGGKPKFVKLKRSQSHHERSHHDHHHHHHRHRELEHGHKHYKESEYYMVRIEDWKILKDRDRILSDNNQALGDSNKSLITENQDLRTSISAVQAEAHRLEHAVIPDLQCQIASLQADNQSLRRSVDNAADQASKHNKELDKLQCRIDKLEKENKEFRDDNHDLRTRVRALLRQLDQSCNRRMSDLVREVDYWKDEGKYWKSKYYEIIDDMDIRTERMKSYEEILRRNGFL